jgi:hypothetical protein
MSLLLLIFACAFLFVEVEVLVLCFDEVVVVVPVWHERLIDGGSDLLCLVGFCDIAVETRVESGIR